MLRRVTENGSNYRGRYFEGMADDAIKIYAPPNVLREIRAPPQWLVSANCPHPLSPRFAVGPRSGRRDYSTVKRSADRRNRGSRAQVASRRDVRQSSPAAQHDSEAPRGSGARRCAVCAPRRGARAMLAGGIAALDHRSSLGTLRGRHTVPQDSNVNRRTPRSSCTRFPAEHSRNFSSLAPPSVTLAARASRDVRSAFSRN